MKKISKMLLPLLVCAAIGIIVYGAGSKQQEQTATGSSDENSILTIEGDGVRVIYDENAKSFTVTDPYGYVWDSVVNEALYGSDKLNDTWSRKVKSIFHISYADISDKNPAIKTAFSYDADISAKKTEEGIRLDCAFKEAGISLAVVIGVDENEMVINIPTTEIEENKKYRLLSVDVLPYMGACADTEEGYLVYPDGCGALKYHSSVPPATMRNTVYSWDIYGNELKSLETLSDNDEQELKTAMLPVFGIKKGEHALIAFSENGEEEGSINMYPSGYGIELNRMSFSFRYRTSYDIQMSNININGSDTAKDSHGIMYNEKMIDIDHDVHYSFLADDKADYSGMAGLYREKLLADGTLQKTDLVQNTGISVNILMAASEQGFWSNSVAVTTNVQQAEQIIDAVDKIGFGNKAIYTLEGWSQGGYGVYPQSEKPDKKVASVAELKKLMNSENLILLQSELFCADEENGGFSKRTEVIKQGNQNVITNDSGDRFWFNMDCVAEKLDRFIKKYDFEKQGGISLQSIGKILYRDENEKCAMNRGAVRDAMEALLQKAGDKGVLSVEGANLYTLKYADMVYELPSSSSEYYISDRNIPFCQMILHGSIVYTGDYGNLSSNYDRQMLEWLEYGYTPAFILTYSSSEQLNDTNCSNIYTSQYESNTERIKKANELYENVISKIADAYITGHTELEDGFIKIDYSNKHTLLINYTGQTKEYEGVTVEGGGYVMAGD